MSGELLPHPDDIESQLERYRATFYQVCDETGLALDAVLDDQELLESVRGQVRERLGGDTIDDLELDSVILTEALMVLGDGDDDGLAGDREPRITPPTPNVGSIALQYPTSDDLLL